MNTKGILDLALQLAELETVPADSDIYVEGENLKKVMIGVDIDTGELLLAKQLGFDAVIAHHPAADGPALNLYKVMARQIDRMVKVGIPINKAQKALSERMAAIGRGAHTRNYDKVSSAARMLGMPFMNVHMPCDILAENKVQEHLDGRLNEKSTLQDVIDAMMEIPEYRNAKSQPVIRCGSPSDYAGKVYCIMAGGTNGGDKVAKAYYEAGIGTLIAMHMPDDVLKAIREQNIGNVIVAGHMASDSIGLNQFIAGLEANGLEVVRMSGICEPK